MTLEKIRTTKEELLASIERDQRVLVTLLTDLGPGMSSFERAAFANAARELQQLIKAKQHVCEVCDRMLWEEQNIRDVIPIRRKTPIV